MTAQNYHEGEDVHSGSKRRSPPTVQSDDDHHYPPSPSGSEKIVQTTKSKGIVNVQLFIRKAFAMINECDPTIASWTEDGTKFVVKNKDIFASTVIPQYYDHNNYSSFTRQLNFYGFTREQSMTIKVSDLNSLAVGQETFFHQNFQRGRPDLLKNLQRRSSDTKNSKKRKKPRTDGDVSFLQHKIEGLEETAKEMMATMKQLRDESYANSGAIRNLQNLNAAKDEKIASLEKRIEWLERRLPGSSSSMSRQESYMTSGQRLLTSDASQGLMSAAGAGASAFDIQAQQDASMSLPPADAAYPATAGSDGAAPTLARHPKMKKFLGSPTRDMFSYENSTNNTSNQNVSRETSLDFGLLAGLARETSLLSWMPRQETQGKTLP